MGLLLPKTVLDGRYRIDHLAGKGGHGVVYRAWHLELHVPVAIKILRLPEHYDSSARSELLANFKREGRVLSRLSSSHPAFVQAKETGSFLSRDGRLVPYLVLEWLDGLPLSRALERRRAAGLPPFGLNEVVALLDRPAVGLSIAHRQGIAHRDLKPGNLFVALRNGAAAMTVLDFGLAKVIEGSLVTQSRTDSQLGSQPFTPAYGAPEQWLSRLGSTGPWTDVHAWALICIELLSGRPALAGADSPQLMGACLDSTRPTPLRSGIVVSTAIEAIFEKALALQPDERYGSMDDFWQALRAAAGPVESSQVLSDLASLVDVPSNAVSGEASALNTSVDPTVPATASRALRRAERSGPSSRRWASAVAIAVGLGSAIYITRTSRPEMPLEPLQPVAKLPQPAIESTRAPPARATPSQLDSPVESHEPRKQSSRPRRPEPSEPTTTMGASRDRDVTRVVEVSDQPPRASASADDVEDNVVPPPAPPATGPTELSLQQILVRDELSKRH